MEDALVLANVLNSSSSADTALDRFVAQREPRVRWVRDRTHSTIAMLAQAELKQQVDLGALLLAELQESYRPLFDPP